MAWVNGMVLFTQSCGAGFKPYALPNGSRTHNRRKRRRSTGPSSKSKRQRSLWDPDEAQQPPKDPPRPPPGPKVALGSPLSTFVCCGMEEGGVIPRSVLGWLLAVGWQFWVHGRVAKGAHGRVAKRVHGAGSQEGPRGG